MWNRPWKYAEGWVICSGLLSTGLILQLSVGRVDTEAFYYPFNLIAGGLYILLLLGIHLLGRRYTVIRWFSGLEASITSLVSLLALVVVMGLTRQLSATAEVPDTLFSRLGFIQMTMAWPFALLFFYLLSVVGLVTLRRISSFRWKDIPFYLNHAGLFIALWAAVLGNGDLQRLRMTVAQGAAEWRATDENGKQVELPLAIELTRFTIDEYPPKLVILDNVTGKALPEEQPANLLVEEAPLSGRLLDWNIEVTASLPMTACVAGPDTVNFVPFHSEGATSALYVKAKQIRSGEAFEGWVSPGNYMFPYVSLPLGEKEVLVIPEREPKRFASDVVVYTKKKERIEALIEVNKPLRVDGWDIYQLSYDETKGKWSTVSVFELVSDPWLPFVYAGIWMMLAGSVCLFITAPKKKEE